MSRARLIMKPLEVEIDYLESQLGITTRRFSELNHPSCGISGAVLIRSFIVLLATATAFLGLGVLLGLLWGTVVSVAASAVWIFIEPELGVWRLANRPSDHVST